MLSHVRSMGLLGIEGYEVSVECFITNGLPAFDVVGLPDAAVKESRERVRAAIKNCGFKFPVSRITLNLAPAGTLIVLCSFIVGYILSRINFIGAQCVDLVRFYSDGLLV